MKAKSTPPAPPEYELKHRLAGAVIIVALGVLLIPWLLSDRDGGAAKRMNVEEIKLPDNGGRDEGAASASAAGWTGWIVQVGIFSRRKNADSTLARLADGDFDAHEAQIETASGAQATRIWLGPYASEAAAGEVNRRLRALTGEQGFVTEQAR